MTLLEHLGELRKRLMRSLFGVGVGFLLVYSFAERIFDFLLRPLCSRFAADNCPMVYTNIAEPFLVYLKVGLLGGVFVSAPWIFYQIWLFIRPGLKATETRYVIPFVTAGSVMFVGGALLGYFFIFPLAFDFFLTQASQPIHPMLSMGDYFSFAGGLLLAFGALFEIPVFVVILNFLGILPSKTLWATWRYVAAGIFVLAAVLTPADPYTMLLLGVPLFVLYIIALVFCSLFETLRGRRNLD